MSQTIESGVPIPPKAKKWIGTDTAAAMACNVGDSWLVSSMTEHKHQVVSRLNKRLKPKKFTGRRMEDGFRIWRIA
jgi:hypothetical protein